jgi:two-component system LytT family response regulator
MPHIIKTVIADPDCWAVDDLRNKLKTFPKLNIVAEARNSCDALKVIQDKLPDLIFLNAEMTGKSGFDITKMVRDQVRHIPIVIFTTHHPEFISKALRTVAIDYLPPKYSKSSADADGALPHSDIKFFARRNDNSGGNDDVKRVKGPYYCS